MKSFFPVKFSWLDCSHVWAFLTARFCAGVILAVKRKTWGSSGGTHANPSPELGQRGALPTSVSSTQWEPRQVAPKGCWKVWRETHVHTRTQAGMRWKMEAALICVCSWGGVSGQSRVSRPASQRESSSRP